MSVPAELARERITALHRAFGHAGVASLRSILRNRNFAGVTMKHLDLLEPCDACMLGKARRASKKRRAGEKATAFGTRLCADCSGPFRKRSVGGSLYLLVVVDEFSAWTWVVPMPSLKYVCDHLTTILETQLHQRDDHVVKFFRSDGGREFVNKKVDALLHQNGIV